MANSLVSPGVQVTVIDESNYAPTAVGTIPFILLATAQDKTNAAGTLATATTKENAGKIFNIGDQRSLVNQFGLPVFPIDSSGNRIYGSELAEYGLYASHNVLSSISSCYVMRADIDLGQLEASEARPFAAATGGTLWLDSSITSWGIFEWDEETQTFIRRRPTFLYTADNLNNGVPISSYGKIGDYAIVGYQNADNPLYYKNYDNQWVLVGSTNWQQSVPTLQAGVPQVDSITPGDAIKINGVTITASGATDTSLVSDITGIPGVTAAIVDGTFSLFATTTSDSNGESISTVTVGGSGTGKTPGTYAATIGAPDVPGGVQANGTVTINSFGNVATFNLTVAGSGYVTAPSITCAPANSGGSGTFTFTAALTSDANDGKISISNVGGGTILTELGITAGSYARPTVQFSKHSSVPLWKSQNATPRPSGSIWIKTTEFNSGANMATYRRNSITDQWNLVPSLVYANDYDAIFNLDPTRGGLGIAQNSLYTQYDTSENGTVTYKVFTRYSSDVTRVTGTTTNPSLTATDAFTIRVSQTGSNSLTSAVTITVAGSPNNTVAKVVEQIAAQNIPNLSVSRTSTGAIQFVHDTGGVIILKETNGTPLADMGITSDIINVRDGNNSELVLSNWIVPYDPALVEQPTEPTAVPADGTLWYYSGVLEADILINENNTWKGYKTVTSDARNYNLSNTDPNGPIFSFSEPTLQSDGTALVYGDLWIDTSDFDNYPKIWRWQSQDGTDQWVQIDTTDATTENGIVFADARWDTDGESDIFLDDVPAITDLLVSNYTDLDCPDPELYPNGCLLFNTRRSSNNVKKYVKNYFTIEAFPQVSLPSVKATWQSYSGKKYNNVPFMGRQAVRNVIVSAMKQAVDNSEELREEGRPFNLLACPGYPELLTNLKELNDDRKNTGFIIGEVPMGLSTDQTTVENYLIDAVGSGISGEDGLTNNDAYTAVFYPGAATVNALDGVGSVVVPMSALMLKTIVRSDQLSEIWFAPAGNQRGGVDAIAIGYVDRANNNAFVRTGTPQGLRDLLYRNRVNPVTFFPQVGIINYGNHTRQSEATALDRINVARLVAYLRNRLEQIIRPLVFEPNDKITRDKAKAICDSLLNDVAARRGVYDFLVVCDRTNNTNDTIDRNELHIDIAIEPVKSVEFIYIPVRIKATGQIREGNLAPSLTLGQ